MNFKHLHEVEFVEMHSNTKRPVSELLPIFRSLGFSLHDDVVSLDRKGRIPPWQARSIIDVEVLCGKEEVFGFGEGEWDDLRFSYLFASLPFELAERFIEIVFQLSDKLEMSVTYHGGEVIASELKSEFSLRKDELFSETGEEPGSEALAILIQSTYPRS